MSLPYKPQNILDDANSWALFMTWKFNKDYDTQKIREAFATVCGTIKGLNNSAAIRYPKEDCTIVLGVGYEAWTKLELGEPRPSELLTFPGVRMTKHHAPGTGGDIHFHIRGNQSFLADAALAIRDCLKEVAYASDTTQSFRYHDGRSILGFVDGTENPKDEERRFFGLIGDEEPRFQGGSYCFVQKYIHDMDAWRALSTEEQEKVIGRTKVDDIEMSDDERPANAHSAVANVGDDKKVIRGNLPFGNPATNEMGTYFIAYARSFKTVSLMVRAMFIGTPPGNTDAILDFSTAVTGALFFCPNQALLSEWAGLE